MIRSIRIVLLTIRERQAFRIRNRSICHFARWAKLNNELYCLKHPGTIKNTW